MSRAVILPTPGDPILLSYWLKNFATWAEQVDQLYVLVTWPVGRDIMDRITKDVWAVGGQLGFSSEILDHGQGIDATLATIEESHVVLMEDDLYVRDQWELNRCFTLVEGVVPLYDVVGASRGSSSMEIVEEAHRQGHEQGAALWPHLLFARTKGLVGLHESFTPRTWEAGEEVRGLGYVVQERCFSDTGVAATIALREQSKVYEITSDTGNAGYKAPWFHVGSLSTGPLGEAAIVSAHENWQGWAARVAWWNHILAEWPGGLPDYCAEYGAALVRLNEICSPYVAEKREHFARLVNW